MSMVDAFIPNMELHYHFLLLRVNRITANQHPSDPQVGLPISTSRSVAGWFFLFPLFAVSAPGRLRPVRFFFLQAFE